MTSTAGNKNMPPETVSTQAPATPVHDTCQILDVPKVAAVSAERLYSTEGGGLPPWIGFATGI